VGRIKRAALTENLLKEIELDNSSKPSRTKAKGVDKARNGVGMLWYGVGWLGVEWAWSGMELTWSGMAGYGLV
jgi:hypothetical protein